MSFEVQKFVNTLELPSVNPFYVKLGYTNAAGKHYYVESYICNVNMELPEQAKLILTPFNTSGAVDRTVGAIVKLRIEYRMQQSLK